MVHMFVPIKMRRMGAGSNPSITKSPKYYARRIEDNDIEIYDDLICFNTRVYGEEKKTITASLHKKALLFDMS